MKISSEEAEIISKNWISLWNENTLEKYLEQYNDDVELVSNIALLLFPESNGRIIGKKI